MRTPDYLITTAHGARFRRFIWNSVEPTSIESQEWFLEKTPYGVQIVHRNGSRTQGPSVRPIRIDPDSLISGTPMDLPCDPFKENSRKFRLSVKLLTPLRAAYLPTLDFRPATTNPKANANYTYYIFEGVRYFLSDFRQIQRSYTGTIEDVAIFSILRGAEGFQINVYRENLYFKVHGEKRRPLRPGEISLISEEKFTQGSLQWGKNWWRVNRIRIPEQLQATEFEVQHPTDAAWLKRITQAVGVLCISLGITLHYLPELWPHKKIETVTIDLTKIALKQPKLIPKRPEEKPKPPPPPPVVVPPPPPPKPAPPKETPKPPAPKPVKKKEAPPKVQHKEVTKKVVPKPVPLPPPPVSRPQPPVQRPAPPAVHPKEVSKAPTQPPPAPALSPAQLKAQQQAQLQAQLSKSLGFLSPSKTKLAPPSVYVDSKDRKYGAASKEVGTFTKSSVLSNIASNSAGADGPINTHASRNMSSEAVGGGKRKGLNEVQGRVSLNAVSGGGGLGSSLSSRGISLSGSGQISEAAVEKTLAKYLSKFQYCYEKALLSDSSLAGTILMQWVISPGGGVSGIKVVRSQMNDAKLHGCITQELAKIQFPSPKGGPVIIKYPFAFSSSSL